MSKQRPKEKLAATPSLAQHVPGILLAAVVALFVATPILPSEAATPEGTHATLGMLWCLLLGCWSAAAMAQLVPPLRLDWTLIAGLVLIGLHALSAIVMSQTDGGGRLALNTLWIWVDYGIGTFLLRQLITSAVQSRAIVAVMVALSLCLSTHAYFQYFVSQPAFQKAYQANPEKFLKEGGYSTEKNSVERKHLEDRMDDRAPLSTFALTNSLAGLLAPWLIIAAGIGLGEIRKGGDRRVLLAALLAALFLAGCLLLTKSRTAVLAAGFGALLLMLYGRRGGFRVGWKIPVIGAGLLVLIGLGVVFAGGLDAEVLSEAPKALLYRLQYWRSSAAMIADYPLFGVGPGRFQAFFARYKLPEASETVSDPHNFLLEIWATAGTPALIALLAMLAAFAAELWLRGGSTKESEQDLAVKDSAAPSRSKLVFQPSNESAFVYSGALVGFILGIALASMAGYFVLASSTGGMVGLILLGMPVAAAFLWSVSGWVRGGDLQPPVLVIGLIVLGVNLLAAGAFSFPGVAQTAWILIPLALSLWEPRGGFKSPPWTAIVAATSSAVLAAACYFTSYAPVLNSSHPMAAAELVPFQSTDQMAGHYAAAAAADPWSAAPWERLAEARLSAWLRNGFADDLTDFQRAAAEYARHEAPSPRAAQNRSRWYLQLYARSQKPADREEALAAAREAVARYPASALAHAELAAVWKHSGDDSAAQMEAEEALRLDKLNPHEEFKLHNQHLTSYQWNAAEKTVVSSPRVETAEQTMLELRKGLRPKT
ncbi:MAG: O-antigen ligase family protein [Pirellulaceae bacterium]